MKLLDRFLDVIAPYNCVNCGHEGSLLCRNCQLDTCDTLPSRCYCCKKLTQDFAVCEKCRRNSSLKRVWVRSEYNEVAKKLIYSTKFKSAREGSGVIAVLMTEELPVFPAGTTVVHIPSAAERKRQRGYDHAEYIARKLAHNSNLNFQKILGRHGNARQVGATREVRLKQLQGAFYVINSNINDKHILLVDDIVTTGGTLEAAAKALRQAGAKQVDAVVFAQK